MAAAAIDYSQILFDASGKPYWHRADGSKVYLPPLVAMQSGDARAVEWARSMGVYQDGQGQVVNQSAPGASLWKTRGEWDQDAGEWHQGTNWNNIASIAVGGYMAAPAIAAALPSAGGAGVVADAAPNIASTSGMAGASSVGTGGLTTAGTLGAAPGASVLPSTSIAGAHAAVPGAPMAGNGGFLGPMKDLLTDPKFLFNTGANLASGYMGARAAGKAADQQAQSAREALELQRGIYTQQRSDQLPWLNAGRGAVSTLSRLMGVDSNPADAMPFGQSAPQMQPQRSPFPSQTIQSGQQAQPRASLGMLGGGQQQMVMLRAPDGETRQVPMQQAEQLIARGATRVN
jgi:hypothetical protein